MLAHCQVLTVQLHTTLESAKTALRAIDRTGCGGACIKHHQLISLELEPFGNHDNRTRRT